MTCRDIAATVQRLHVAGDGENLVHGVGLQMQGEEIQTLHDAVTWTAILGGYQTRKHDPPPGADLTGCGRMKRTAMCEAVALYDLAE